MPAHQHDDDLDAVIRRVIDEDKRVVFRRGKDTVAVIPTEDLQLLEALEDARDAADSACAPAEDDGEQLTWEELKARLDL
ncbi:MAG: type II toxin-antitoxin system Phd/YefM family antitoxin [Egibacteraceae bacterium]